MGFDLRGLANTLGGGMNSGFTAIRGQEDQMRQFGQEMGMELLRQRGQKEALDIRGQNQQDLAKAKAPGGGLEVARLNNTIWENTKRDALIDMGVLPDALGKFDPVQVQKAEKDPRYKQGIILNYTRNYMNSFGGSPEDALYRLSYIFSGDAAAQKEVNNIINSRYSLKGQTGYSEPLNVPRNGEKPKTTTKSEDDPLGLD